MSRWIDADALAYLVASNGDADFINRVTKLMIDAPSIDIVRCKECKWWWKEAETCKHDNLTEGDLCATFFKADDFCSYGEREGE